MPRPHWLSGLNYLALAVALILAGAGPAAAIPAEAQPAAVDPLVYAALAAAPDGEATFILLLEEQAGLDKAARIAGWNARGRAVYEALRGAAARAQAPLLAARRAAALPGRISRFEPLWIVNAIVVHGDRRALDALARQPGVARVLPDVRMAPLGAGGPATGGPATEVAATVAKPAFAGWELGTPDSPATVCDPVTAAWGVPRIGATAVWEAPYNAAGQGIVIGIVDTGVQWDHPALKGQYRGWNAATETVDHNHNWYNPAGLCDDATSGTCDADTDAYYPIGHGTHVTGIAAGWDGGAAHIGVAPGARWIHAVACNSVDCPLAATLAALQWMLAPTDLTGANPDPSLRPQVVNNSWGGFGGSLIYEAAIAALRAAGIVPVFAAGNSGAQGCGTLLSPGDNPSAFGVGSTNPDNGISSFSSRGPNPFSGDVGPDLAAPGGGGICSSEATGDYGFGSGTSMAASHAAGAVALLLSAEPALLGQVDQIEEILRATSVPSTRDQTCGGVPGTQTPNNVFGWGRLDVLAAAEMIWQAGTLSGAVTDAGTGLPIAGAQVAITRAGRTLTQTTPASGGYSFVAGSGVYDVAISAFGYAGWAATGVGVTQDAVTTQDAALAPLARAAVSGQVTEFGSGAAIGGATVTLIGASPPLAAQTDATGAYALAGVSYGSHVLRVTAPGYATADAAVTVAGPTVRDAALAPAVDYAVYASGSCAPAYAWIDASSGTVYNLSDDGTALVTLPGPFSFYGNSYNSLYISANGFLSFGAAYSLVNGVIPFEGPANNAIYALAADLNPAGGGQGRVYTLALSGNRFVIQWDQVQHYPSGHPETFEVVLYRNTGNIVLQYQVVSQPAGALVGVEDAAGARGHPAAAGGPPPVAAGAALRFMPFSGQLAACSPLAVTLADFSAAQASGAIAVTWETVSELNNRGFNLWRGTSAAGPDVKLNDALIPSQSPDSPAGFVYTWEDSHDLVGGATYWYWLEDLDANGALMRHAPVSAQYNAPTAVGLARFGATAGNDGGWAGLRDQWIGGLAGLVVLAAAAVARRMKDEDRRLLRANALAMT